MLFFVASGCSTDDADSAGQPASSSVAAPITIVEGDIAATEVGVGDCLSGIVVGASERSQINSARKVHCFSPHAVEVFAAFTLRAEDFDVEEFTEFPGRAPIVRAADRGCIQRLDDLLGEDESTYGLLAFWPTRESWDAGDRTIACAVFDESGEPFMSPQFS